MNRNRHKRACVRLNFYGEQNLFKHLENIIANSKEGQHQYDD